MNCVGKLLPDSLSELTVDSIVVYTTLLNNCSIRDELVVSNISVEKLYRLFSTWEEIPEILSQLAEKDLLRFTDAGIVVGEYDEKITLFGVKAQVDFSPLERAVKNYLKVATTRASALGCRSTLQDLKDKPVMEYSKREIVQLYRLCAEAYDQHPARNLTGAEVGKLSYLVNNFDLPTVVNMVIYFFENAEVYCRNTAPTVGLLLYHKDTIARIVRSQKVLTDVDEDSFQKKP